MKFNMNGQNIRGQVVLEPHEKRAMDWPIYFSFEHLTLLQTGDV